MRTTIKHFITKNLKYRYKSIAKYTYTLSSLIIYNLLLQNNMAYFQSEILERSKQNDREYTESPIPLAMKSNA
jgi:hypothetical protein